MKTPPSGGHLPWALLNRSLLPSVTCLIFFHIAPMCFPSSSVLFQQRLLILPLTICQYFLSVAGTPRHQEPYSLRDLPPLAGS
ncbi:hypothetical protein F2P81_023367 [Scophthalmus maximus]|uniref:Uncharacterized protein n=1 Tax=Scophthalmus maximus TaxID=52904 RepID=A0A6A4RWL1_SCOMX|nr:hypothetical protein F2P81_023367 [Scophthalmus maximus]